MPPLTSEQGADSDDDVELFHGPPIGERVHKPATGCPDGVPADRQAAPGRHTACLGSSTGVCGDPYGVAS